jgi:hypothetical protein
MCLRAVPVGAFAQVDTLAIPLDITPLEVSISSCGGVKVLWPGDPPHMSVYSAKWLQEHAVPAPVLDPAFDKATRRLFDASTFVEAATVPASASASASSSASSRVPMPEVDFADVMRDDAGLLKMLAQVRAIRVPL